MLVRVLRLDKVKCFPAGTDIDLCVGKDSPHKWVVIYGDNGLGKSTLLKAFGAELGAAEPHRAILRDMILDVDVYPSVAPIIRKAIAMLPHLTAWAAAPLQSTPRRP